MGRVRPDSYLGAGWRGLSIQFPADCFPPLWLGLDRDGGDELFELLPKSTSPTWQSTASALTSGEGVVWHLES